MGKESKFELLGFAPLLQPSTCARVAFFCVILHVGQTAAEDYGDP